MHRHNVKQNKMHYLIWCNNNKKIIGNFSFVNLPSHKNFCKINFLYFERSDYNDVYFFFFVVGGGTNFLCMKTQFRPAEGVLETLTSRRVLGSKLKIECS